MCDCESELPLYEVLDQAGVESLQVGDEVVCVGSLLYVKNGTLGKVIEKLAADTSILSKYVRVEWCDKKNGCDPIFLTFS